MKRHRKWLLGLAVGVAMGKAGARGLSFGKGSTEMIPDEKWAEFSLQQVKLLQTAGFSREKALYYYPSVK